MLIIIMHSFFLSNQQADSSSKHELTSRVENSVDHEQPASQKPADHGSHCFQNSFIYRAMHDKGLI